MKKMRAVCLMLAMGLLTFDQLVIRAEAEVCYCYDLEIFCAGFCHQHRGVVMVDCHAGMGCQEVCACGDGEVYAGDPTYCEPCN